MHAAPPVRMSLACDAVWRAFGTLCTAIAAANVAGWLAQHARQSVVVTAAAAFVAASVAATCLWAWWRRREHGGVLAWDGAQWSWTSTGGASCVGEASVVLDLGPWLLLRFEPAAATPAGWLVATRRMAGLAWPTWRAALYSYRTGRDPVMP